MGTLSCYNNIGIIGDTADAITIFIIVVINAILGFIQEYKTEKSLEALKEFSSPTCKVFRDGSIKVINYRSNFRRYSSTGNW